MILIPPKVPVAGVGGGEEGAAVLVVGLMNSLFV
jgi:hypothetical protein